MIIIEAGTLQIGPITHLAIPGGRAMKREEWMLGPPKDGAASRRDPLAGLFGGATRGTDGRPGSSTATTQPRVSSRELNPHFKNGGTGLPPGASLFTRTTAAAAGSSGFMRPPSLGEETGERKRLGTDDAAEKDSEPADLNRLQARRLKAELAGDSRLAGDIEAQIRMLRRQQPPRPSDQAARGGPARDLTRMVREERRVDGDRMDRHLAERIMRHSRFEGLEELSEAYGTGKHRLDLSSHHPADKRARRSRSERNESICALCACAEGRDDGSVVAIGEYTYLRLPLRNRLDPLHCQIVPLHHLASYREADDPEDGVWTELRNFKKCLLSLGASLGRPVVFLETAPHGSAEHAAVDAVFLPRKLGLDPSAFYRQSMKQPLVGGGAAEDDDRDDLGGADLVNDARLVDTAARGLRKSIPRGFPYAYVDLRLDEGIVRVIDSATNGSGHLRGDYLLELTADLFGLERHEWRRASAVPPEMLARFKTLYDPLDWTRLLHES